MASERDVIEIRRSTFDFGSREPTAVAAVRINGVDLRALVLDALERRLEDWGDPIPPAPVLDDEDGDPLDDAGAFLPISVVAPPSRHWLGRPKGWIAVYGAAGVLTCTCEDFGCGGTAAHIAFRPDTVEWSDFVDSAGSLGVGTATFDRRQYEHEIEQLRT